MSRGLRILVLDEDSEDACERLADAMFPHFMDSDRKERVRQELVRFLQIMWRGPLA